MFYCKYLKLDWNYEYNSFSEISKNHVKSHTSSWSRGCPCLSRIQMTSLAWLHALSTQVSTIIIQKVGLFEMENGVRILIGYCLTMKSNFSN